MKKKLVIAIISLIAVLFIAFLGYYIWFLAYHTCVEWESKATGRYCRLWMTIPSGKSSIHYCADWRSCKKCTKWLEDDRVREKPKRPQEACR